jgi:hypothetical protein
MSIGEGIQILRCFEKSLVPIGDRSHPVNCIALRARKERVECLLAGDIELQLAVLPVLIDVFSEKSLTTINA